MCKRQTNNTWAAKEDSSVGGGEQYPEKEGKEAVFYAWCGSVPDFMDDVLNSCVLLISLLISCSIM